MVAGLETPTEGEIYIAGQCVTRLHPRERKIAMVFQDYALYPHMNVEENLSFGLQNLRYPKSEIKKRVAEVSAMLGLLNLLDRKPKELSGGQRQRVALGRAIVRHPEVFLFDEPLSNLDAKLRIQMRVELSQLQKRLGVTSIYVTHDQVEAMTLGEEIVVMNNGVVQQVGTPVELFEHPQNIFVASFIGSPPMNFTEGEILHKEGYYIQMDDICVKLPEANADRYAKYIGRKVIVGVRPIHLRVGVESGGVGSNSVFHRRVALVEYLGSEALLYLQVGDKLFVCRTELPSNIKANDVVDFEIDGHCVHLFDKDTQRVI